MAVQPELPVCPAPAACASTVCSERELPDHIRPASEQHWRKDATGELVGVSHPDQLGVEAEREWS